MESGYRIPKKYYDQAVRKLKKKLKEFGYGFITVTFVKYHNESKYNAKEWMGACLRNGFKKAGGSWLNPNHIPANRIQALYCRL